MTNEPKTQTTLMLLVGSNPLPNYLAACAIRPERLALVYTTETTEAKCRLKTTLADVLVGTSLDECHVPDATSATEVQRVLGELCGTHVSALLNYTGGTKVMAAHARMAFQRAGGQPTQASYLDEGGAHQEPRLRFDDGTSKALSAYPSVPLSLSNLLGLHGLTHSPRSQQAPAPTFEDAEEILCKVAKDVALAEKLYKERKRLSALKKPSAALEAPFKAANFGLELTQSQLPASEEMDRKAFEQWYRFIGGEWLEEWVGKQIRQIDLTPLPEITIGVDAFRGSQRMQMEIDLAVVRGHRSYFISCTTDTTKHVCKSKLFEVAVRSRQLGGDLARAAMLCLADDKITDALRADIDDLWGSSNTTRVFGLSDVTAWSGCGGKQPNRHSLATWLES